MSLESHWLLLVHEGPNAELVEVPHPIAIATITATKNRIVAPQVSGGACQ